MVKHILPTALALALTVAAARASDFATEVMDATFKFFHPDSTSTCLKTAGVQLCSPLFVLTYPQRFESHGAGLPVARQGIFASPPHLPLAGSPTYLADFTTFAGDSGGPVFIEGADAHPLVTGIVIAQSRHDETVKTEDEDRVFHHPLGLGSILHSQLVRDTVEAAARPVETSGE